MSALAGYVIVRHIPSYEMFWGFIGVRQTPHWVRVDRSTIKDALIFEDHIKAEAFRMKHGRDLPLSRVEPIIVGDSQNTGYEAFQEACAKDLEGDSPTLSTQHDECAAQIFERDSAFGTQMEHSGILAELIQTGSVTVRIGDKNWELNIHAKEVADDPT